MANKLNTKLSTIIFLLSLMTFSSCHYIKNDSKRSLHPLEINGRRLIYVQNNPGATAYDVYDSGDGEIPVWCNIEPNYQDVVRSFNNGFAYTVTENKKTEFVCYSGDIPDEVVNVPEDDKDLGSIKRASKGNILLEEVFSPYQQAYIVSLLVSMRSVCIMKEFFSLYRKFCLGQNLQCCISPHGDDFIINIITGATDEKYITGFFSDLNTYLNKTRFVGKDTNVLFASFESIFLDECSKQRWYYDAIYSGIKSPQKLLDRDNWDTEYCSKDTLKVKKLGVKILDINKLSTSQLSSIRSNLEKFLK